MKSLLFVISLVFLSGCVTNDRVKADLTPKTPEQIQREVAVNDCIRRANAYGGSTPQGHRAVIKACMYEKGL